ncbi:bombyxin-related peptide B-like isoform X2 [Orbicella faveolata]|nr:bombyxin-related peptide B-like isoform X2 [Orbicella faveolata]XP_020629344.1 bombyxin-related peptide B-like isoform X2 [Orbicella faveolata]
MKNACFWSIVALVAIALCLETAKGKLYKLNEVGSRKTVAIFCGDRIRARFDQLCPQGVRKRRSALMDEQEALSFLNYRSPRSAADGSTSGRTNIVEECCQEGCASEEILEYC